MQEGISTQASFLPVFLRLLEKKRYRSQCFQPYIIIVFVTSSVLMKTYSLITISFIQFASEHKRVLLKVCFVKNNVLHTGCVEKIHTIINLLFQRVLRFHSKSFNVPFQPIFVGYLKRCKTFCYSKYWKSIYQNLQLESNFAPAQLMEQYNLYLETASGFGVFYYFLPLFTYFELLFCRNTLWVGTVTSASLLNFLPKKCHLYDLSTRTLYFTSILFDWMPLPTFFQPQLMAHICAFKRSITEFFKLQSAALARRCLLLHLPCTQTCRLAALRRFDSLPKWVLGYKGLQLTIDL